MAEANGKLRPEWANGALLPPPLNDSELFELMEQTSGLALEDGHVLVRRRDVHLLRQALGRIQVDLVFVAVHDFVFCFEQTARHPIKLNCANVDSP